MNMKRTFLTLLGISAVLFAIQGCSSGGSYGPEGSWGNYKCTASSAYHQSIGWAASRGAASQNALDKCRAHGRHPEGCHIVHCVDESVTG